MMKKSLCTKEAFNDIYDKYSQMIYRISLLHTGNEEDAKDIMQEVFMKLIYTAPCFDNHEHEKKWIIRVTVNLCHDHLRSYWRKNKVSLDDYVAESMMSKQKETGFYITSGSVAVADGSYLTNCAAVADETSTDLSELIFSMPDKYKDVIHLHYFEGYSIAEIAKILEIGESAVKMRLKRGRTYLKMELE